MPEVVACLTEIHLGPHGGDVITEDMLRRKVVQLGSFASPTNRARFRVLGCIIFEKGDAFAVWYVAVWYPDGCAAGVAVAVLTPPGEHQGAITGADLDDCDPQTSA